MLEFYGDHPALDLINTVVQGEETWHGDADVMAWLAAAGQLAASARAPGQPGELLAAARALRETVRSAVAARKAGRRFGVAALNAALAHAERHLVLVEESGDGLSLHTRYAARTPEQLLAPLAEAAAQLLATADFRLVRKCEDHACTLWFLDRTKSHRRRWCSMTLCGNRNKVAAFRQRQHES
ncbi:CGNR zinc finger domain-containing protein [Pseudoduganella sp. HUAS MS19]